MRNFFLGILFVLLGIPAIENFTTWLESKTSLSTYKIAKDIYKIKREIGQECQEEKQNNEIGFHTQCVGYDIPITQEYEEQQEQ